MKIIIEVEGRAKILVLGGDSVQDLRDAFTKMCRADPVLSRRIVTHYPTFMAHHSTFGMDIELEQEELLAEGKRVRVHFAAYEANETAVDTSMSEPGPSRDSTLSNSQEDLEFMQNIGMRLTVTSGGTSTGTGNKTSPRTTSNMTVSSGRKCTGTEKKKNPGTSSDKDRAMGSAGHKSSQSRKGTSRGATTRNESDSSDNEYLKASEAAQVKNRAVLQTLNLESLHKRVVLRPKKQRKSGDENAAPQRSQPARGVKSKRSTAEGLSQPLSDDELLLSDEDDPMFDNTEKRTRQESSVTRKNPMKKRRLPGEKITKNVPLPPFPDDLNDSFLQGLVYSDQTHTRKFNNFLKDHVRKVTQDSYPTTLEYAVLKTQVEARLTSMKIPNVDFYASNVVSSLSASLRNDRNYLQNKKPKQLAAKQMLALANTNNPLRQAPTQQAIRNLNATEAELLLKEPVRNKETTKSALVAAANLTANVIPSLSVKNAMDWYPYLKHPDLVMQDFANKAEQTLSRLEENFEKSLRPLVKMLSLNDDPEEELAKINLMQKVNAHFEPNEKKIFPCLQICDVSILGNDILDNIPKGQAPALVVTANDTDIVTAIVVFNKEPLYNMTTTSAFQSMLLLLAVYFVYNIQYPSVYKKMLLTLEHILSGESRLSKIDKEVKSFFKKFLDAKKLCV